MLFFKIYFLTLLIFFTIDMVWLGFLAKDFYQKQIGFLMAKQINWLAAVVFYLLFVFGLIFFVIYPGIEKKLPPFKLFLNGALFGLIAYATYDLTNLATLKNWPVLMTIVDIFWGSFLSGITSLIIFLIF
ncbi:MAG: DUF2177 family protein [Patescibacteria group bacterium]|nr:DUF2177 family protein [Patescibacteria group bacterium]